MKQKKLKYIIVGIVLFITFLLNGPLWSWFISTFAVIPSNFLRLFVNLLYYIALIICTAILTKERFCLSNLIKISGIIIAFLVVDSLANALTNSADSLTFSLIYQSVKPLVTVFFVWLAYRSVCKCETIKNRKLTIIFIALFMLNVIFDILDYIRIQTAIESVNNEFYGYLAILSPANSIYAYLSQMCLYGLIFISFIWLEKSTYYENE